MCEILPSCLSVSIVIITPEVEVGTLIRRQEEEPSRIFCCGSGLLDGLGNILAITRHYSHVPSHKRSSMRLKFCFVLSSA